MIEEKKYFIVDDEEEDLRLDVFISSALSDLSRTYIQSLIKDKKVTVNDKIEKSSYKVAQLDNICILIPPAKELVIEAEDIPIEILYEDEDLAVVYKERGMVVHPGAGNANHTLVNALMYHFKGQLSSINGIIRPGIVHRIDKDTSGLLMIAKSDIAHRGLSEQLKEHTVQRTYTFICHGNIKADEFTIDAPIGRNPRDRMKMAVVSDGKHAVTHITKIKSSENYSYAMANLETGRTHQIRVHMASKGLPLVGDTLYGPHNSKFKAQGQLLHAKTLGFVHPVTGEFMLFEKEEPEIFKSFLQRFLLD